MVGTAVVVSLTRGTDAAAGFIYLLRPRCHRKSFRTASSFPMPTTHEQADFAHAKSFVLCSFQPTKSACSASAEKCLSGVGQPLSSVSGRQRYNTLDFASKIVCQQGCSRPYWKPCVKGDSPPLNTPYFLRCEYPSCKNTVWNTCSENAKEAVLSHNTCVVELLSFIELQHQTGSAKPVQYLHSCRLIVAQFLEGKLPDLG